MQMTGPSNSFYSLTKKIYTLDTCVLRRTHNLSNPRKDAQRWSRTPINTSVKAYVVTIKSEPKKFSWVRFTGFRA